MKRAMRLLSECWADVKYRIYILMAFGLLGVLATTCQLTKKENFQLEGYPVHIQSVADAKGDLKFHVIMDYKDSIIGTTTLLLPVTFQEFCDCADSKANDTTCVIFAKREIFYDLNKSNPNIGYFFE